MLIVLRFAKRDSSGKEVLRQKVIEVRKPGTTHFNWNEAAAAAVFHVLPDERIVMIAEAGYH